MEKGNRRVKNERMSTTSLAQVKIKAEDKKDTFKDDIILHLKSSAFTLTAPVSPFHPALIHG